MARGINKVILIGNLGRDPETRYSQDQRPVTTFSVATSESWTDRNTNERHEQTEWHDIVCFRRLAEIAGEYLRKGSKVYIEGRLQTRSWEGQDGQKRYRTEVIARDMQMLDSRGAHGRRRRLRPVPAPRGGAPRGGTARDRHGRAAGFRRVRRRRPLRAERRRRRRVRRRHPVLARACARAPTSQLLASLRSREPWPGATFPAPSLAGGRWQQRRVGETQPRDASVVVQFVATRVIRCAGETWLR